MKIQHSYYTYFWLRADGTPYYVGKGKENRAFTSIDHNVKCPINLDRIIVQYYESESEAYEAEVFFIAYFGRKDLSSGCLRNLTNGGDGFKDLAESTRQRISDTKKRNWALLPEEEKIRKREISIARLNSALEEKREAILQLKSEQMTQFWASRTDKEMEIISEQRQKLGILYWSTISDEKREARRKANIAAHRPKETKLYVCYSCFCSFEPSYDEQVCCSGLCRERVKKLFPELQSSSECNNRNSERNKGKFWITNGVDNTTIKDKPIPEGWRKGQTRIELHAASIIRS